VDKEEVNVVLSLFADKKDELSLDFSAIFAHLQTFPKIDRLPLYVPLIVQSSLAPSSWSGIK
jgi:hypothetical protein